ncbi:T9SS type A sorting domain-containing protein [Nibribacter koreensis]|uniref:Secretion system C-terminal sorting domain-containing protein n=1 Tax=Nibribacter koreensis TaxID=1084519 RepID=A0ABP8FS00_9BACT
MRGTSTKLIQWLVALVGILLIVAVGPVVSAKAVTKSLDKVESLSNKSSRAFAELNNASALKGAIFSLERSYRFITKQYYWVGGAGAWEDVSHWATTSGGAMLHTALPTAEDDVFFDANSFTADNQTVSLNDTARVRNISWLGVRPSRFDWNDKVLQVYGSYDRTTNASFIDGVKLVFKSNSTGNTISSNNTPLFSGSSVTFDGLGGEWTLQDDMNTNGSYLYLNAGTLNTNNKTVSIRRLYSTATNSRVLNLGASELTGLDEWQVNASLVLNSGTSIIRLNHPDISHAFAGAGLSYNQVFLNSVSTTISGANTFQVLTIASGKTVRFPTGLTTTVNQLSSNGSCGNYTTLESTSAIQTVLNVTGSSTSFSSVVVKGIKSIQPLTATNSLDGGNNTNWTFSSGSQQTFYWVGGSGNWSDPTHWSSTSGGAPNGACAPGPFDNVIFDSNSLSAGETVTLDQANVYVNSISGLGVTANSTFNLAGKTLQVGGSMEMSANISYGITKGIIVFTSSNLGEKLNFGNGVLPNGTIMTFSGSGEYSLNSGLNVGQSGRINLNAGQLKTNNQQVLVGSIYSTGTVARTLDLGASSISGLSVWSLTNTGLTFNKGTSTLIFDGSSIAHTFAGAGFTYNAVTFQATSTTISGVNNFASLSILPGKALRLPANVLTTVGNLVMNGDCAGYTKLESTSVGVKATLSVTGTNRMFNYIAVKDIAASPNTLTAINSANGGNTTGWSINSVETVSTYYWVGGTGNWSDTNHWATTSGGVAAICSPGPNDNVVFDANSFTASGQKVTLDQPTSYVNNITWESGVNNPVFNLNGKVLQVSGETKLSNNMNMGTVKGTLIFDSKNFFTNVDLGGLSLVNGTTVTFNGTSNYLLANKLDLGNAGRINLNSGSLLTNNKEIVTGSFYSTSTTVRSLNLGSSTIIGLSVWSITATNLTLEASNSFLNFNNPATAHTFTGGGKVYNNVSFNGATTTVNNSNTFKMVTVAGGKTLNLQSGQKQTMEELVTSSIAPLTTLKSSSMGSSALAISSEEFCSDYLAIQNVTVSGTATFYAGTNSTLTGTTTGWDAGGCDVVYAPESDSARDICNNTEAITSTGSNQWQELRYDGKLVAAIKDGGNVLGNVYVAFTINSNNSREGVNANIAPRNWTIASENQPNPLQPVSIRFYGMVEEFNDFNNSVNGGYTLEDLSISKYSGSLEDCSYENSYVVAEGEGKTEVVHYKSPTYTVKGNYFIAELPAVYGFSEFYMHDGAVALEFPVNPLPVELVNFNATPTASGAKLMWQTASEQDNAYFEVQSTNNLKSGEFKTLGRVNTKDANSNTLLSYEFLDATAARGTAVYYRLKQVDIDGTFEYSKVVSVNIKQAAKGKGLVNVYPNPFKGQINLEIEIEQAGELVATLYDARGYKVFAKSISVEVGASSILVDLPTNLRTGLYFLTTQVDGTTKTTRLIKE